MNTREVMDRGINYTVNNYCHDNSTELVTSANDESYIEKLSIIRSALALTKLLRKSPSYDAYTEEGLKGDMKFLTKNEIKAELLKNIVSTAIYNKSKITEPVIANDVKMRYGMNEDDLAVHIYNNMLAKGAKRGYYLLSKYSVLFSACELYARNRSNGRQELYDEIARNNSEAIYMNNEIDKCCQRTSKIRAKQKTLTK